MKIQYLLAKIMSNSWRKYILTPEFDYNILKTALKSYSNVRSKITQLLKSGEVIRVKKGLYVLGEGQTDVPYSKELLANLMYGPSYVSLDYALSYHGIIPERVPMVTSVTTKRNRHYSTPIGEFSFHVLPIDKYNIDFKLISIDHDRQFLMASKEKALADKIWFSKNRHLETKPQVLELLVDNFRIDEKVIQSLSTKSLKKINRSFNMSTLETLIKILKEGIL